jgi:ADP-ribose pyrophosphatase YjhB (NUDIX family)
MLVRRGALLLAREQESGLWLPPHTAVRPDETPEAAVLRAVLRETGLRLVFDAHPADERLRGLGIRVLAPPTLVLFVYRVQAAPVAATTQLVYVYCVGDGAELADPGSAAESRLGWFREADLKDLYTRESVKEVARYVLDCEPTWQVDPDGLRE